MQNHFINTLQSLCPEYTSAKYLLTISGGIDSMILLALFEEAKLNFGIAHCNFQLRDKESLRDEKFVKEKSKKNPLHKIRFNTIEFANKNKLSIQEAARDLRYKFFHELAEKHNYDYIVLAHNRDDLLETFFINLNRSAGIKGLASIPEKNGSIIRPILDFPREEIGKYATENKISFVEDSSNATDNYLRNSIRHHLIPKAENIMPGFSKRAAISTKYLRSYTLFLDDVFKEKIHVHTLKKTKTELEINLKTLITEKHYELIFLHILQKYKFQTKILNQVLRAISSKEAKFFFSNNYQIIIQRDRLQISEKKSLEDHEYFIDKDFDLSACPIPLNIELIEYNSKSDLKKDKNIAQLEYKKLKWPLILRKWKTADRFVPLGMSGSKKISDYLTDRKIQMSEKKNTYVLCSDNTIVCIIGHIIDDRFSIKSFPNKILKVKISK